MGSHGSRRRKEGEGRREGIDTTQWSLDSFLFKEEWREGGREGGREHTYLEDERQVHRNDLCEGLDHA